MGGCAEDPDPLLPVKRRLVEHLLRNVSVDDILTHVLRIRPELTVDTDRPADAGAVSGQPCLACRHPLSLQKQCCVVCGRRNSAQAFAPAMGSMVAFGNPGVSPVLSGGASAHA